MEPARCPNCQLEFTSALDCERHYRQAHLSAPTAELEQDVTVRNVYSGKKLQIWGVVLFLLSLPACLGAESATGHGIGMIMGGVGLGMYCIGRFEHWYNAE